MTPHRTIPVPDALLGAVSSAPRLDDAIVVLGAGCAGLTLAVELKRRGERRPVVLLDGRSALEDDRVWCFWSDAREPAAALAGTTWDRWTVRTGGTAVRRGLRGTAYRQVRAGDFVARALDELAAAGGVALRLGEPVLALEERPGEPPLVTTPRGTWAPHVVIDARGPLVDRASVARARTAGTWIGQEFAGLHVRTARPAFDPSACELMDFRTGQEDGVRFLYVLPTSPTEALVESVRFSDRPDIGDAEHRRRVLDHLRATAGLEEADVTVLGEERGCIPMTDERPPARRGVRYWAAGAAGGAVRPSSGYAFLRIQRSCAELAAALVEDREPQPALDGARRRLLDDLFLRFLRESPDSVPGLFARMFARTPSGALVRFLTDRSSPLDELLLIAALPKTPFLRLLARQAVARLPRPHRRLDAARAD